MKLVVLQEVCSRFGNLRVMELQWQSAIFNIYLKYALRISGVYIGSRATCLSVLCTTLTSGSGKVSSRVFQGTCDNRCVPWWFEWRGRLVLGGFDEKSHQKHSNKYLLSPLAFLGSVLGRQWVRPILGCRSFTGEYLRNRGYEQFIHSGRAHRCSWVCFVVKVLQYRWNWMATCFMKLRAGGSCRNLWSIKRRLRLAEDPGSVLCEQVHSHGPHIREVEADLFAVESAFCDNSIHYSVVI